MKQSKENKYWGDVDLKFFDTATEQTCTCAFNVEWVSIYKRWRASRATSATCSIEKDAGAATAGKREEKNSSLMQKWWHTVLTLLLLLNFGYWYNSWRTYKPDKLLCWPCNVMQKCVWLRQRKKYVELTNLLSFNQKLCWSLYCVFSFIAYLAVFCMLINLWLEKQ